MWEELPRGRTGKSDSVGGLRKSSMPGVDAVQTRVHMGSLAGDTGEGPASWDIYLSGRNTEHSRGQEDWSGKCIQPQKVS